MNPVATAYKELIGRAESALVRIVMGSVFTLAVLAAMRSTPQELMDFIATEFDANDIDSLIARVTRNEYPEVIGDEGISANTHFGE